MHTLLIGPREVKTKTISISCAPRQAPVGTAQQRKMRFLTVLIRGLFLEYYWVIKQTHEVFMHERWFINIHVTPFCQVCPDCLDFVKFCTQRFSDPTWGSKKSVSHQHRALGHRAEPVCARRNKSDAKQRETRTEGHPLLPNFPHRWRLKVVFSAATSTLISLKHFSLSPQNPP